MSSAWTAFEHHVWAFFKEHDLSDHNEFLLAVSGGLDSMVLLELFARLKPQAQIRVAYYHHGFSDDKIHQSYRDQARTVVKKYVENLNRDNFLFISGESESILQSEDEMRKARWAFLRGLEREKELLVTAHHLDDHLETMLLKLIRGTSIDGLTAFKMWNGDIFRPLLSETKVGIAAYAEERGLDWVEDPSNQEQHYLRNWIREKWLKDLNQKVPSGSQNLARSLFKIAAVSLESPSLELELTGDSQSVSLRRQWFMSLSKTDQLRALALFLKKHQIYQFTTGQLEEIRKRLDKNQKDLTFEILGRKWVINASQIMLQ